MTRAAIFGEIEAERLSQDATHGRAVDDGHRVNDWVAIIARHLGLMVDDGKQGGSNERYHRQLVRVAAVAVAALEAHGRKTAPPDPLEWAARVATEIGEAVYYLSSKQDDPRRNGEGPPVNRCVPASMATVYEASNGVRVEPESPAGRSATDGG